MGGRTSGTRPKGSGTPAGGSVYGASESAGAPRGERAAPFEPGNQVAAITDDEVRQRRAARRRLEEEKAEAAFDHASKLMTDATSPHATQLLASKIIMDRVYGTPKQMVELTGRDGAPMETVGINTADPIEAAKVYRRLMDGK